VDQPPIVIENVAGTCWLRLNRPEKLNALSPEMMSALSRAVDVAEEDKEARVLVITGNGRAFSSGGDLDQFRQRLGDGRYSQIVDGIKVSADALTRLARCSKPVIAAVNGIAVAGGLEMILCCDIVIAAAGTLMGDAHLKYGVLPGGGGSVRLMRKLPHNVAKSLLLTGALLPAERFRDWGLVNEIVDGDSLTARASEIAAGISKLSPLALAHVKRVADMAADVPEECALAAETGAFREYVRSRDFSAGVQAFADKQEPLFLGH
jgi:enoyl-CoA hydratase/carnithine racemase